MKNKKAIIVSIISLILCVLIVGWLYYFLKVNTTFIEKQVANNIVSSIEDNIEEKFSSTGIRKDQFSWIYRFWWSNILMWSYLFYYNSDEEYENWEDEVTLLAKDYPFLDKVMKFHDYLLFDFNFDWWKLISWKLINKNTGEEFNDIDNYDWSTLFDDFDAYKIDSISEIDNLDEFEFYEDNFIYNDTNEVHKIVILSDLYYPDDEELNSNITKYNDILSLVVQPWEYIGNELRRDLLIRIE